MTETGLIVAEVVFLVLLYAFVWSVVRSANRQLRAAAPPPVAHEPAVAAPERPRIAPAAVVPPVDRFAETLLPDPDEDEPDLLDLHANIEPRLIVETSEGLEPGLTIPLPAGITIGRSDGADLTIDDVFVSHMHARIMLRGPYHFVEDLGSTNGTFLNDRRIEEDAQLKVHDSLKIGQTTLRYEE